MIGTQSKAFGIDPVFSVVRALALQVRVLSLDQVARGWFADLEAPGVRAQLVIDALRRAKLIERRLVESHPLLPLEEPLFAWRAGAFDLDTSCIASIAQASQQRWTQPFIEVELFTASKRANRLFGTFVDSTHLKRCEATHDYHLAELFVRRLANHRSVAKRWWGEGAFPKLGLEIKGFKDPDAFIVNDEGEATCIVEFAGSYDEEHLESFHRHCTGRAVSRLTSHVRSSGRSRLNTLYRSGGTSYELW